MNPALRCAARNHSMDMGAEALAEQAEFLQAAGIAQVGAGQNLANPIATILSMAMMLHYSCGLDGEAQAVEAAVIDVLNDGYRTYDIMDEGRKQVGTREMGELVAGKI